MLEIKINNFACETHLSGNGKELDLELTIAATSLIMQMAKLCQCSFETAALMLFQQASLLHKDNPNPKEFN